MWVDIHTVGPHPYILTFLQSLSIQYIVLSEMRTNGIHRSTVTYVVSRCSEYMSQYIVRTSDVDSHFIMLDLLRGVLYAERVCIVFFLLYTNALRRYETRRAQFVVFAYFHQILKV